MMAHLFSYFLIKHFCLFTGSKNSEKT